MPSTASASAWNDDEGKYYGLVAGLTPQPDYATSAHRLCCCVWPQVLKILQFSLRPVTNLHNIPGNMHGMAIFNIREERIFQSRISLLICCI